MADLRVLFADTHHLSSRIAAAYFERHAPRGVRAVAPAYRRCRWGNT